MRTRVPRVLSSSRIGGFDIWVLERLFGGFAGFTDFLDQSFHLADGIALSGGLFRHLRLQLGRGESQDGAGVAHGEAAFGDQELNVGGQPQQPDHVGDGGAILAGASWQFPRD